MFKKGLFVFKDNKRAVSVAMPLVFGKPSDNCIMDRISIFLLAVTASYIVE